MGSLSEIKIGMAHGDTAHIPRYCEQLRTNGFQLSTTKSRSIRIARKEKAGAIFFYLYLGLGMRETSFTMNLW